MTRTHTRNSGEHYEVKRSTPSRPVAPSFTLEDLAKAVANLSTDPDGPDLAVSIAEMSRKNSRQQYAIVSLSGVVSLLIASLGLMVSYLRGYTKGEDVSDPVVVSQPEAAPALTIPTPTVVVQPAHADLLTASAELQIQQFDFLSAILASHVGNKRKLIKPSALLRAEATLRHQIQASRERSAQADPAR